MVNLINVSKYTGEVPKTEKANRKIKGEPLYNLDDVLEILKNDNSGITAWTQDCNRDLQKWGYDLEAVAAFFHEHLDRRFYKCSEWCRQRPQGPWAACDVYVVKHLEHPNNVNKPMMMETYIKFAISKTGALVMLISFHPPENK